MAPAWAQAGLPTIAPIADQVVYENDQAFTIPVTITPYSETDTITMSAWVDNPQLVQLDTSGDSLTITPQHEAFGTATITVSAYGTSASPSPMRRR